jgi:hypothetical protein
LPVGQNPPQLGQRKVGTIFQRTQQTLLGCRIHAADRTMPLLDALGLPSLPLLPENLLPPTKAYPKHLGQLKLRPLARRMCCQELPSQIIVVG